MLVLLNLHLQMSVFKIQMKMKPWQKIILIKKKTTQLTNQYVSSRIKALYENGWFIGTVKYFNTSLQEYYVVLTDDTEDYIAQENTDGGEV